MTKDARFFTHDSNASSDPKVKALIGRHGMAGYGRWWVLVETLRDQANYRMPKTRWSVLALAQAWGCDEEEAQRFLLSLEQDFELLVSDDSSIWSESLIRRMATYEEIRTGASERGKRAARARWGASAPPDPPVECESNAHALPEHSTGIADGMHPDANVLDLSSVSTQHREAAAAPAPEPALSTDPLPAAALTVSALREKTEAAGYRISDPDLEAIFQALRERHATVECVVWIVERMRSRQVTSPGIYLLNMVRKHGYVQRWQEEGHPAPQVAAEAPKGPQLCPECKATLENLDGRLACIHCRKDWRLERGVLVLAYDYGRPEKAKAEGASEPSAPSLTAEPPPGDVAAESPVDQGIPF